MGRQIKKAAVIGSGVMGSGIAAHLANIGIPSLLLDIVPRELTPQEEAKGLTLESKAVRNRISTESIKRLAKQKPAPLATKSLATYIEPGNLEDDLARLSEVDWIIEVVVENLDIKRQLFEKVDAVRTPGTIVTSNTSGISIEAMAEGRSEDFQAHFLGTHFFNPPRYLKLLEVIPTEKTNPDVLSFVKAFAEDTLGKGVVECKDTPNFIANRIGTYGLLVTANEMLKGEYSVGEIDSVTGPLIGRPKSATFRTLDVVGLDTFLHVAKNVYDEVEGAEKDVFDPPAFMKEMAEKGMLGSKSGQGFFVQKRTEKGKEILELNPVTLEYQERKKLRAASVEQAKQAKKPGDKLKVLAYADDRAGQLIWNLVKPTLLYSAEKAYEIANDIKAVDEAMRWGFGWELGPFEMWDAIGVAKSVERMEAEGETVPGWVKEMLETGNETFYKGSSYFHQGEYKGVESNPKNIHLKSLKPDNVVMKNSGASLIDIGDDVALLEFHSPNNSIGLDVIQMVNKSIEEVEKNFKGLVISNQGKNFCVGANLMMILMEAQDDNFFEIDLVIRQFQQAMANVRYSAKPVVTGPFGMTLGGGAEICLPSASIQAAHETYMGLVEVGVGLIPGGGGNKELYLRNLESLPQGAQIDLQAIANKTFETIAMAKVATSAHEARENGFLSERDGVVMNGEHVIHRAKQQVIHLEESGYRPPERKKIPVVGETGYATLLLGAKTMKFGGMISDHDLKIAEKLAFVLAGGRVPKGTLVDEQYLLDLEREAFLSLVGEPKSQQRMQYMLTKGKPLRN
ncbi:MULTISPECIES: 3-hydroxyacyl-CoA dehydrogenase/enoyl-CoA hydratase family protein [Alkalihalophilus]|uniref:3-hydroxyacyl-CoA dehydrogenase/enoyl-CoA hydratase/isomerase n=1 Tax=Alkalihalophilus pseudofirmus (strain ATCC BAA-2126 / JCM 17055 / OF4) TaxID=398511 RepID=D3FZ53_ALKPO|nr:MULTISPECIES: 3-hydroxyacyl-CoA dehydrogenase/enoyl-CoA hydratase family protein [Alkalihalophilus]ADC49086.1 3-hydroxyacyl-CoA dehydrogenase/enoyl-CoA hydratase/isomerase [Alkalihalophilus pseudofirmus OF4]MEC2071169.1 3-hydroxyacyl-CoA dehydrogenase NAD-binding domain-containing protein [Alkalihalophilus marmarensis]MED1600018.1 3-hydroxyacyl-CoA dehydrogenase NAD-binding domain-containing protein [Alkalihalophilus marmarensis]WEG16472.1 3-hydroxyacyl-CoA dehydrogenase NAD-binding domain-c